MRKSLVLAILVIVYSQVTIDLLYGSSTKLDFRSEIVHVLASYFDDQINIYETFLDQYLIVERNLHLPSIVIDVTFSIAISRSIKLLASDHKFIHIVLEKPSDVDFIGDYTFYTHSSIRSQFLALSSILSYMNWEKFLVISADNYSPLYKEIKAGFFDKQIDFFWFSPGGSQLLADQLVSKQVLQTGVRNLIILNE